MKTHHFLIQTFRTSAPARMLNPSKTNGFSTFLSNGASRATFALTSNCFNNVCAPARATIPCKKGHAGHMRAAAALLREVSEIGGAPGIAFQSYDFDGFNWRSGAWRLLSPFGDHTKGILWKALQRDSIGPRLWTSRSKAARNFAFLRVLWEVSLVPPLSHLHLMHRAQDSRVPLRSHPFILCTGHRIHDSEILPNKL